MRVVFVDNLLLENGRAENLYLQPHLGLISLIAVANGAGHTAWLYDPKVDLASGRLNVGEPLYREIADRLLEKDPDVVGFTSLGCTFICAVKIARHLKARKPGLPILLGGPHATILDREILSAFGEFDVIVRNEAELTLLPVLDGLFGGDLSRIPGITYRSAGGVAANPGEPLIADLDTLPFPAFDSYPLASLALPYIQIEAGRGCPFKCSFCSTATFFGRRYRLKSPQRIGAEMDHLHARYGFTHFALTHDLFTVDRRKVLAFCRFLQGKGYTWQCSARMDCVDDELLAEMAASGCRSIYYGVETGSPRMQKIVDKHLNLDLVEPRLAATRRLGMTATASFITGFPEEEQSDQDETLDMVGRCLALHPQGVTVQIHLLTPEPGTGLTQRLGHALEYDGHVTEYISPTVEEDDASIMQGHPGIFMNHHYYPTVVPRRRHVFVTSANLALQTFGSELVAHLTEFYEGRFSRLLEDMDRWFVATGRTGPCDGELVCAYVRDRWKDHYLVSLFEYLQSARSLSRASVGAAPRPVRRPLVAQPRVVLSPRAAALTDIHNAPRILEALSEAADGRTGAIPPALQQGRLDLLVFVPEGSFEIQTFELDAGARELTRFLSLPRSIAEVGDFARSLGGDPSQALACVRTLREGGAVIAATEPTRSAPRPRGGLSDFREARGFAQSRQDQASRNQARTGRASEDRTFTGKRAPLRSRVETDLRADTTRSPGR